MKQSNKGNLYAVYGTLRHGFHNHRILEHHGTEFLGSEVVHIPFRMVSLGPYPGLVSVGDGLRPITVEVYQVIDPGVDHALDAIEGYPHFYDKTIIKTKWGEAYIYFLHDFRYNEAPPVYLGDWAKYTLEYFKHY